MPTIATTTGRRMRVVINAPEGKSYDTLKVEGPNTVLDGNAIIIDLVGQPAQQFSVLATGYKKNDQGEQGELVGQVSLTISAQEPQPEEDVVVQLS